jgi:hypothetical protein
MRVKIIMVLSYEGFWEGSWLWTASGEGLVRGGTLGYGIVVSSRAFVIELFR